MRIYEVNDDLKDDGRWCLGETIDKDGRLFAADSFIGGRPFEIKSPLAISLRDVGYPLAFTFASFDVPVVSARVADILSDLAPHDVQPIPLSVEAVDDEYYILNVVTKAKCLSENASLFKKWTEQDGRPDMMGSYRMVAHLSLDRSRLPDAQIFRIEGWEIPLLAKERIIDILKIECARGLEFEQVEVV